MHKLLIYLLEGDKDWHLVLADLTPDAGHDEIQRLTTLNANSGFAHVRSLIGRLTESVLVCNQNIVILRKIQAMKVYCMIYQTVKIQSYR